ncbi:collagen-like protein [Streptomyces sp. NPDC059134]|uniref:collagen-like triple helix repeat-containing protein n=1 Tax=Streptomyces sp. NPDC059134 TaxID=3346738 RepID=UPI00367C37C0
MTKLLLSLHVIAAIVAIGPVTVAASMFPPAVRHAMASSDDRSASANVALLHRICRVYAVFGVAVPVFGFATAKNMGVLGDTWLIVSIALTLVAAVVLGALVLPRQSALLELLESPERAAAPAGGSAPDAPPIAGTPGAAGTPATSSAPGTPGAPAAPGTPGVPGVREEDPTTSVPRSTTVQLAMFTGVFNLLWAAVTILMIIRPGSTTGA